MLAPKRRNVAIALALLGAVAPLPLTGLHKFYLGEPVWGVLYLILAWTPIPRVASLVEGLWYLSQGETAFRQRFAGGSAEPLRVEPERVGAIATAVRELDRLRQEGLLTEQEFEQKRRGLLSQID